MAETTTALFEGYTGPALELSVTEFEALTNDTTADTAPIMCNEPGCMNSIDKPARGRTPKFCVEHKPSTRTPQARSTNRGWAKAGDVERALLFLVQGAAAGLQFTALSADGKTLELTGPQIVREIVELAKVDKKLQTLLERLTAPGKYAPLIWAVIPLCLGVAANHNLLPQFVVDLTAGDTPRPTL